MTIEIGNNKPKFYLIQAGVQEFIANLVDESTAITLGSLRTDGKDVTYVSNINQGFISMYNIFQESVEPGHTKPSLQRVKGTVLTLNVNNINNIAVVPKELQDRLSAAVAGIIV